MKKILIAGMVLLICIVMVVSLIGVYKLPSAEMQPAIRSGSRIIAQKHFYTLKRGDIIMFVHQINNQQRVLARRLVGLPGETIAIRDENVFVNGREVKEPSIMSHTSYYQEGSYANNGKPVLVPQDKYYVLGDNSKISLDSRIFGFVSKEDIRGKVIAVF